LHILFFRAKYPNIQNGNMAKWQFQSLRGNANKIKMQLFLGVGGRGLAWGSKNNAGKTALSATAKNAAKWSVVE
jgi:hypothetical protein